MSVLHAELDGAHLMINELIQEQRSEQGGINHPMKWLRHAVESVAGRRLEVVRKLRKQIESLNQKLGGELAESKGFSSNGSP